MEIERKFKLRGLSDKETKSLEILELARKKGAVSRTDISKFTGVNIVSVSNYVKDYIAKGLVVEKGLDVSTGGRKPELVELNAGGNYVIGLDVSQREIKVVIADLGMNVVAKRAAENTAVENEDVAAECVSLMKEAVRGLNADIGSIKAVGISVPEGDFAFLAETLQRKFRMDAFLTCRATCAAAAEKRLNPDADVSDLLYIHSDTGRGVAARGNEFIEAAANDEKAKYLRPWSEALSIVRLAKGEVAKGVGTKIVKLARADIENITEGAVIEAARQKDEVALNIIEAVGINLGLRIAYLINLFSPKAVVIGGGPQEAGGLILENIRKMVSRFAFAKEAGAVKIVPSTLGEDAASLGASSLAIREIFLKA